MENGRVLRHFTHFGGEDKQQSTHQLKKKLKQKQDTSPTDSTPPYQEEGAATLPQHNKTQQ